MVDIGEVDLLTKEELAALLISRTKKPALVIFEEDDGTHYRCYHSFAKEGTEAHCNVSGLLHALANGFDGCEFVPARQV